MKIYMTTDLEEIALTARGKSVFIALLTPAYMKRLRGRLPGPPPAAG